MNKILLIFILLTVIFAEQCDQEEYNLWKQSCHINTNGNYLIWQYNCLDYHQIKNRSQLYQMDFCKNQFADIKKSDQSTQIFLNMPTKQHVISKQLLMKVSAPYKGVDWRDSGHVTPVRNQGSCGCCWAFVTAAMFESHFSIHNASNYHVSQEFILQCTGNNSTCNGGYINYALSQTISYGGIPNATFFPYLGSNFSGNSTPYTADICTRRPQNYYKFSSQMVSSAYTNVNITFLQSLLMNGPVGALFNADSGFMSYTSGVYSCGSSTTTSNLNHAVLIVGFKSDDTLIIKNSYGTGWGINGYGYINSSYNNCGIMLSVFQLTFEVSLKLGLLLIVIMLNILS